MADTFLIVGAGLAGAKVKAIRSIVNACTPGSWRSRLRLGNGIGRSVAASELIEVSFRGGWFTR